ncbi:hypothetical protein [Aurantibacter sp.]|uniref:hypothetical protein n=1 Tax=Aurantibacter sp. TaxID=2807103 RepID=UPI003263237E
MKINWIRYSISILFLAIYILTKMGGLHVFTHESEEDHGDDCNVCIHVNTTNFTPAIVPNSQDVEIKNIEFLHKDELSKTYSFVVSNTINSDQLFSRPPPYFL